MRKIAAKQQLIDTLIADKQGQFSLPDELEQVLRDGFQGFRNMTVAELIQAAEDANLIARDDVVAGLVAVLEA